MSRRNVAWLLTVPLAVVAAQLAHALAYRLAEPSAHERAHLLSETGHGYLRLTADGLGVVAAAVLFALILEVRAIGTKQEGGRPRLWAFAAFVPATFIFQEHLERLFHDGAFPWGAALDKTFLVGIVVQLPFAVLAYLLARLLLGVAHLLGVLLHRSAPALHCARAVRLVLPDGAPVAAFPGFTLRPRGPPEFSSA